MISHDETMKVKHREAICLVSHHQKTMELALELMNSTSKARAYTQDNVSHASSSRTIYGQRFILFYNIL